MELAVAQQAWGQEGFVWQAPFLDVLAASYGTGVRSLDIKGNPVGARRTVNDWVSDFTAKRIRDLLGPDTVTVDTRLILANALYVKAPWHEPFRSVGDQSFAAPSSPVQAEMLQVELPEGGLQGAGWTAARIPLAGQELALTVVLPTGSPAELLDGLAGAALLDLIRPGGTSVSVTMPAFTVRSRFSLAEVLATLGMKRAFAPDAEFDGLTTSDHLMLDKVEHQGWIAVDQNGLEAVAATAATAVAVSAPAQPELELVLDRPFLICVHDVALGLPLLLGVVNNPNITGE